MQCKYGSSVKLSYYNRNNTYKAVYVCRCSNQIGNPSSLTTMPEESKSQTIMQLLNSCSILTYCYKHKHNHEHKHNPEAKQNKILKEAISFAFKSQ